MRGDDVYLLDTDTISNYLDKRRGNEQLRQRIEQASPETIWISIITFEEIIRGILSLLNQDGHGMLLDIDQVETNAR